MQPFILVNLPPVMESVCSTDKGSSASPAVGRGAAPRHARSPLPSRNYRVEESLAVVDFKFLEIANLFFGNLTLSVTQTLPPVLWHLF